jgi:rubrerythrin
VSQSPLTDLDTFLAYSLALEEESAERLREAAEMMRIHHQHEVAKLFSQLAEFSDRHAAEVKALCEGRELPHLHPWDFEWPELEAPETWDYAAIRYDMTPHQVLTNMLLVERNTADFYQAIAEDSDDDNIVTLARDFAAEERGHASALESWLNRLPSEPIRSGDMDPPVEPV